MDDDRPPAPEEFFADLPDDLDEHAREIVRDLRNLLARVNAVNAQPAHTSVSIDEPTGYLALCITHPDGDPHMTVNYRTDDVLLFWTAGLTQDSAWLPRHLAIVEALLTGANSIRMERVRSRIVATDSVFWPPTGLMEPIHTVPPPAPRLKTRLMQTLNGLRPGASLTMYCQVSYDRAESKLIQAEPFHQPEGPAG